MSDDEVYRGGKYPDLAFETQRATGPKGLATLPVVSDSNKTFIPPFSEMDGSSTILGKQGAVREDYYRSRAIY